MTQPQGEGVGESLSSSDSASRESRRLPARPAGRSQDPTLDRRITDATLALLTEVGPDALRIEAVAKRAEVGKNSVYRRWRTLPDLLTDALVTVEFARQAQPRPKTLRDDLVEGVIAASGCLDEGTYRVVFAVMEQSVRQPEATREFRLRFHRAILASITSAVTRAVDRGELQGSAFSHLLANDGATGSAVIAAAASLVIHLPAMTERCLTRSDFENIVDEVLLPSIVHAPGTA